MPVQIVDARGQRDIQKGQKGGNYTALVPTHDHVSNTAGGTWETTDYSREVAYRHSLSGDKHTYDERHTTWVYHAPVTATAHPTPHHASGKCLVKKQEYVSGSKKYEVYRSKCGLPR